MQEPDVRGGKNWVLGVTALASFMMALDAMVITTAFATIRGDFGASVETLQWTVNAYNLTFAVLLLTGAALGDRFGRRRMRFRYRSISKLDLERKGVNAYINQCTKKSKTKGATTWRQSSRGRQDPIAW